MDSEWEESPPALTEKNHGLGIETEAPILVWPKEDLSTLVPLSKLMVVEFHDGFELPLALIQSPTKVPYSGVLYSGT